MPTDRKKPPSGSAKMRCSSGFLAITRFEGANCSIFSDKLAGTLCTL